MKRLVLVSFVVFAVCLSQAEAQFASPVQILPVVVKAKGKVGTDWRSDLAISNLAGRQLTVGVDYFPEGTTNSFPEAPAKVFTMPAGKTLVVTDVLGTWFPQFGTNTKGMLWVMVQDDDADDPGLLAVSSRAYNAADPNATFGQTVAPNMMAMVFGLGRSILTGIQQDSVARTNIGAVNLSPLDASVEVSIFDGQGVLVQRTLRQVKGLSMAQWSLPSLGVSSLASGRVEVRPDPDAATFDPCGGPSGSFSLAMIMAYSSKVQQSTGDAEFNVGQVAWEQFKLECGGTTPTDDCNGNPFGGQMTSRFLDMAAMGR